VDTRWVLHMDMDAFFASVEQLTRPTLRGRPVLVGGLGGRGVVAGASYESRVYGARSAMPMHQARRMVGATAVVLPPRGVVYGVASRRVFETVRPLVPVLEQLSFDEAFGEPAELAGASAEDVAKGVRQTAVSFENALAAAGVEPIKSVGEQFNPELHEAVETTEVEPKDEGKVLQEYAPGYRIGERLLRPARVKVGRASSKAKAVE